MKTMEEKITVASCLYDKGMLVTSEPLKNSLESDADEDEEMYGEYEEGESEDGGDSETEMYDEEEVSGEDDGQEDDENEEENEYDDDDEENSIDSDNSE